MLILYLWIYLGAKEQNSKFASSTCDAKQKFGVSSWQIIKKINALFYLSTEENNNEWLRFR